MSKIEQENNLLTTAQVAQQLGVSVATINRRADKGAIPVAFRAHGLRGARYFHPRVVEQMKSTEHAEVPA